MLCIIKGVFQCSGANGARSRVFGSVGACVDLTCLVSVVCVHDVTASSHDSGTITASGEAITRRGRARWLPRYRCHR